MAIRLFFYGQDEPTNPKLLEAHIVKSRAIHQAGGQVVTAITKEWNSRLDREEPLDWVNFALAPDLIPRDRLRPRLETYYWQVWVEAPVLHRLYSGFFLWKSGYDGIFPYVYQAFSADPPVSPYQTDVRPPNNFKVFCVTYPAQDQPVPTLQWEAIREGIDDVRYLQVLEALIQQVRSQGRDDLASRFQDEMNRILEPFGFAGREFVGGTPPAPEQFMQARTDLIRLILRLQRVLNAER